MNKLNGIIKAKGNLKSTVNSKVKTNAVVSVGGTLVGAKLAERGAKGEDGYSPSASVSKVGNKATITITDKDGTTTADIYDGSGGGASAFIAEYGVTTYADVKDAYDEDAIILCTVDDSGNTKICQLAYYDDENGIFYFAQPQSDGFYLPIIASDDTWDDGYFQFASTDTATQLRDGLMSALDWQKLDGIASGAEVNVQSDWNEADNTKDDFIKNKPTIPSKTSDLNNDSGFITSSSLPSNLSDLNNDMDVSDFPNDAGYITGYTETDPIFTASDAYGITSSDISNWNGKSDFSGSYNDLTDKPTIPTVNNATLTIQKNGTTVDSFTANASSNVTANITVHDVPSGGLANQVLAKNSSTDYDLKWTSAGGGGGTLVQLVRW